MEVPIEQKKHFRYSPSGASRWLKCPGSLREGHDLDDSNDYSRRGDMLHELAERYYGQTEALRSLIGKEVNGFPFEESDYELLSDYHRTVDRFSAFAGYAKPRFEVRTVHTEIEDFGGTIDCVIEGDGKLYIIDLKTGYQPVRVEENDQLLSYAACRVSERASGFPDELICVIVQPGRGGVTGRRSWKIEPERLEEFLDNVREAVRVDQEGPDTIVLGDGSHCNYCRRIVACPAIQEVLGRRQQTMDNYTLTGELDVTPEELADMLDLEPTIKKFFEVARKIAVDKLEKGTILPRYKLVRNEGRLAWTVNDEEVERRLKDAGLDNVIKTERKLPTPTQIKKMLGESFVEGIAARPEKGVKLAHEDSRAEGVDPVSFARNFTNE